MLRTLLCLSLAAASAATAAPLTPGRWMTVNGSTLTLTRIDQGSGALAGEFVASVAQEGCQAAGQSQPVVGWYDERSHAIAFTAPVRQPGCRAVLIWSGHYDEASGGISTHFERVSAGPSTISGASAFARQP